MTTLLSLDADLSKSIEDFRQHIRAYQSLLKQQGTWLLLATLGCWSVAHGAFQWAAYAIVLLVFVDRMKARTGDERSFKKIAEAIAQQIHASDLADDTKKARLWDLKEVQETELGAKVATRRNLLFFVCWLFFGFSFMASVPFFRP